jgi:uncharacterized protein YggE
MNGIKIGSMLIAALLICFMAIGNAFAQTGKITVSGSAEVRVVPDEVVLTFGIASWDENLGKAKADNDRRLKKSLSIIRDYNIPDKDIKTGYLRIEQTPPDSRKDRERGYNIYRQIELRLDDLSKFEDIISAVLEAGINELEGTYFQTTEVREYKDQARVLAVRAASEKASAFAGELGQQIGKALEITEGRGRMSMGSYKGPFNVSSKDGGDPVSEEAFSSGQISITAVVSVVFELK